MQAASPSRPWILGSFAVYASSLTVANQVYELIASRVHHPAFGTVVLETGEEVDYVDMAYSILRRSDSI